jgi:hypothetical protein
VKTCQKFSGETEAKERGEGGEEGLWKTKWPPKNEENQANRERGIMKNEVPSLLLDEKICL